MDWASDRSEPFGPLKSSPPLSEWKLRSSDEIKHAIAGKIINADVSVKY